MQGRWRAPDGRWYPPEQRPGFHDDADVRRWHQRVRHGLGATAGRAAGWLRRSFDDRPVLSAAALAVVVLVVGAGLLALQTALTTPAPVVGGPGLALPVTPAGPTSALSTTLAPPYTGSPSAGGAVTATVAKSVVGTTWSGFAQATTAGDATVAARYGTSAAVAVGAGDAGCACLDPHPGNTTAYVTATAITYPASFLAQFIEPRSGHGDLVVLATFTEAGPGRPWLVTSFGVLQGQPFLRPSTDTTAASPVVPETLAAAPRAFASYFQTLDTTGGTAGSAPAGFSDNSVLQTVVQGSRAGYRDRRDGSATTDTHRVVSVGQAFDVSSADDPPTPGVLEAFTLVHRYTQHAPAGQWYVSTGRSAVSTLSAGRYASVDVTTTIDVTVLYDTTTGSVQLLANQESARATGGTPDS